MVYRVTWLCLLWNNSYHQIHPNERTTNLHNHKICSNICYDYDYLLIISIILSMFTASLKVKWIFFFFFLKSIVERNCEAFCFGKTITNSVVFLFQDICSTMNGCQHLLLRIHMYDACSYTRRIKRNFDKDKVKIIRRFIRAKSISIDVLFQSPFCPVNFGL